MAYTGTGIAADKPLGTGFCRPERQVETDMTEDEVKKFKKDWTKLWNENNFNILSDQTSDMLIDDLYNFIEH